MRSMTAAAGSARAALDRHADFDESQAREIAAMRALENTGDLPALWSAEDRGWASRAAAESVGEGASREAFLAARARLALERAAARSAAFARTVEALRWRSWVGTALIAAAFVAGIALDQIGSARRINLLAPPFFMLLLWNVAVYVLLVLGHALRARGASEGGALRRIVARLAVGRVAPAGDEAAAIADFAARWSRLSAPLYRARAARILHLAAATFALGLLAGLYLRGLAFEYRASWESTFLDASTVHMLLATALAPGAWVAGASVPSVAEIEAIRAPASENAARWLHLIAATVVLIVIAPRLLLALAAWLVERRRMSRIAIVLDEPYYARLLQDFREEPAQVRVRPYSYALPPAESTGLERLLRRVYGGKAQLAIEAPVAYGSDSTDPARAPAEGPVDEIALFNASATPEREAHGAFLDMLCERRPAHGGALYVLVDESAFRDRLGSDPVRIEARRALWRSVCAERRIPCLFAVLRASDVDQAAREFERAVEKARR